MQPAFARARVLHGFEQHRVLEQIAVLDHQIDARDVHMHDAARADVQMPDLAVPHLPLREADERPAGVDERVRIFPKQSVVGWFPGEGNCVGFRLSAVSPAIKNDKNERFRTGHNSASSSWLQRLATAKSLLRIPAEENRVSSLRICFPAEERHALLVEHCRSKNPSYRPLTGRTLLAMACRSAVDKRLAARGDGRGGSGTFGDRRESGIR